MCVFDFIRQNREMRIGNNLPYLATYKQFRPWSTQLSILYHFLNFLLKLESFRNARHIYGSRHVLGDEAMKINGR